MSTSSPSTQSEKDPRNLLPDDAKARIKDEGRQSRLSFTKFGEHQLRKELKEIALVKCKTHVNSFGKCAQENGLWVVWSCRPLLKELNDCLSIHNSEEEWEKYKSLHQDEIDKWKNSSKK